MFGHFSHGARVHFISCRRLVRYRTPQSVRLKLPSPRLQGMVDKARLKNHVRRKDLMCRRRHKTAYGRRQLQIGQQSLLYLYKMHESTEDLRSTPPPHPSAYLGFSFWAKLLNSRNGSDEGA